MPPGTRPPGNKRAPVPPPTTLGPEELQFATLYLSDLDPYTAYRESFDCTNLTIGSVKFRALSLLTAPAMKAHLAKVRAPLMAAAEYTLEKHLEEIEELRQLAIRARQPAVAAKLTEMKGKAIGHYTERSQQTINTNSTVINKIQIEFVDPA